MTTLRTSPSDYHLLVVPILLWLLGKDILRNKRVEQMSCACKACCQGALYSRGSRSLEGHGTEASQTKRLQNGHLHNQTVPLEGTRSHHVLDRRRLQASARCRSVAAGTDRRQPRHGSLRVPEPALFAMGTDLHLSSGLSRPFCDALPFP